MSDYYDPSVEEMTWLSRHHDALQEACEEKKAKTKSRCEEWECLGVGWCDHCLKAAKEEKK